MSRLIQPSTEAAAHDARAALRRDALCGLQQTPKRLPCKYLYDQRGSALFDQICQLPEYYPTRCEMAIMRQHAPEMAGHIGPEALLVELGSGSSVKTRLLLDQLERPAGYVPLDISREHLNDTVRRLARSYPHLPIHPLCADFAEDWPMPTLSAKRQVVYFPGSTVGNFEPAEAVSFLRKLAARLKPTGGLLLIGVDLLKDFHALEAAYNDTAGLTAAFNLNVLARLNRELGADFDLRAFSHRAIFDALQGRVEMHLVSQREQRVQLAGQSVEFEAGESIHTESSYKYTCAGFENLAAEAGWSPLEVWLDPRRLFSVHLLHCGGGAAA